MRVKTESGAVYEIEGDRVRRVNASHEKRGDGLWQALLAYPAIALGKSMVLIMESLARYGGDDHGTTPENTAAETTRITTPVTEILP